MTDAEYFDPSTRVNRPGPMKFVGELPERPSHARPSMLLVLSEC